ncbi:MAG: hypothetical protein NTW98_02110 [Candidatus Nomurabacteria bacterium]|nr:hypothetical protein [Candidatus Nomurabacteria bacterium]
MRKEESFFWFMFRFMGMSFLWGMGILFFNLCIEAMIELIKSFGSSTWLFLGSFTIVGGFASYIYEVSFNGKS